MYSLYGEVEETLFRERKRVVAREVEDELRGHWCGPLQRRGKNVALNFLEAAATDSSERDDQRREVSHALANKNGSLRFTRPPRTGDDGVEDRRGLCVCISI